MFEINATTTTPPLTVVSAGALTGIKTVSFASTCSGLTCSSRLAAWISTISTDSNRHHKGCWWLCYCAMATFSISNGFSLSVVTEAYAKYTMSPPQVDFSFSGLSLLPIFYGGCYGVSFVIWSSHVVAVYTSEGTTIWICTTVTLGAYLGQVYVPPGIGSWTLLE